MRLIGFFFFIVFFNSAVFAAPPLPSQKPITSNFQDVLNNTAMPLKPKPDELRVPSPPPQSAMTKEPDINFSTSGIIIPPITPLIKKPILAVEIAVVAGVPFPAPKPFRGGRVNDNWQASASNTLPPTVRDLNAQRQRQRDNRQEAVIEYSGERYDDRTAGRVQKNNTNNNQTRQRNDKIERIESRPREKLRETSDRSPFATAQLPRAAKYSMDDPVIIFFKEFSPELEIGQIDVLRSDVLSVLNRSNRRKVAVYGYAEDSRDREKMQQLSLNRAMIISEYLVDNGIDASRVEARAMGADTPISPKNRVDIVIF